MKFIITKRLHIIALTVVAIILALWGYSDLGNPMIAEGDAYSRAIIAKKMTEQNQLFQFAQTNVWLPFHFVILSIPTYLGIETYFGQRLITLIIGITSIFSMYFFTKELTKNKNIALIASIGFAFFPLRFFLSTQTLSEGVFVSLFLPSLYFLIKKRKSNLTDAMFIVLYSLANITRFESWYFTPVIICFALFSKDITKMRRALYIIAPMILPIMWVLLNAETQNGFLSFFSEKYSIAQENPNPIFYHWELAWQAWETQLLLVFPAVFLVSWSTQLHKLGKQISPKQLVLFFTPIYLFLILVFQVFSGTMEWFPIRYLLIPLTFIFPVLAMSIFSFTSFFIFYLRSQNLIWKKLALLAITVLLIFISSQSLFFTQEYTFKQLTIASFLSLPNASHISEEDYEKIYSFNSLKLFIEKNISESANIDYFFSENNRSWQDQALFYLLKRSGKDFAKNSFITNYNSKNMIVWEREPDMKEPHWQRNFNILFENYHYYVIALK